MMQGAGKLDTDLEVPQSPTRTWYHRCLNAAGIVAIFAVGLFFARETSYWWRGPTDSGQILEQVTQPGSVDPTLQARAFLEFGDSQGTLTRGMASGSADDAQALLVQQAEQVLQDSQPLAERASAAEVRVLKSLRGMDALRRLPEGEIYGLSEPLPIVAGVRRVPSAGDSESVGVARRVVSWSIGLPSLSEPGAGPDATRWMLYTFWNGDRRQPSRELSIEKFLPPESVRTLSLRADGNGQLVGIRGPGSLRQWQDHVEAVAREKQWQAEEAWTETARGRHRRFRRMTTDRAQLQLEVQIFASSDNQLRGIFMLSRTSPD